MRRSVFVDMLARVPRSALSISGGGWELFGRTCVTAAVADRTAPNR
ncbi:hypothetical protein OHB11_05420 [Streptomyces zaomyceticus]